MHGFAVGSDQFDSIEAPLMLTDTGTTITYLPSKDYHRLMNLICSKGIDCYQRAPEIPRLSVRNCNQDSFEPIWFQLDLHWYKLALNSYIVFSRMDPESGNYECDLKFQELRSNNQ